MKKEIFVMVGKNSDNWCDTTPMGPFPSEDAARAAIIEDVEDLIKGNSSFEPGEVVDYEEYYHILEYKKSFKPALESKVTVTLRNIKS